MSHDLITTIRRKVAGKSLPQIIRRSLAVIAEKFGIAEAGYKFMASARYTARRAQARQPLDGKLIVSLTSYPPRFGTLEYTLKTLLTQSIKPDLVVLWIYEQDYKHLPASIITMTGTDFHIRTTETNTRSFKKLIPTLGAYPDAYIATADDDVYYPGNWLASLVAALTPGAKEVVGHRGHHITLTADQAIEPYAAWEWEIAASRSVCADRVLLTGCAGILYPPGSLAPEVMHEDRYMALCPTADDLWFYFMARKNGYTCRVISERFPLHTWSGSQGAALFHENVAGAMNDAAFRNLVGAYGMPFEASWPLTASERGTRKDFPTGN